MDVIRLLEQDSFFNLPAFKDHGLQGIVEEGLDDCGVLCETLYEFAEQDCGDFLVLGLPDELVNDFISILPFWLFLVSRAPALRRLFHQL